MASFVAASSQRLVNAAAPIVSTGYPLMVGVWVYDAAVGSGISRGVFSATDPSVADQWLLVSASSADSWSLVASDSGGSSAIGGVTVQGNAWTFLLGRFISSTSRRLQVLHPDGSHQAASNNTARAPTGLNTLSIGSLEISTPERFMEGHIAEIWYAATNFPQVGVTGNVDVALMRQLAYGGPFSIPMLVPRIIEYRSLRKHPTAGDGRDIWVGAGKSMQAWSNANGVTTGPHPPLPYWYENPWQRRVPFPF